MHLSFLARTRAQIMRTLAPRLLNASPGMRARLIGWRANPVDGNVCDERLAAMLGVGDLIGATSFVAPTPEAARKEMAESTSLVQHEPCPDVTVTDRILMEDGACRPART